MGSFNVITCETTLFSLEYVPSTFLIFLLGTYSSRFSNTGCVFLLGAYSRILLYVRMYVCTYKWLLINKQSVNRFIEMTSDLVCSGFGKKIHISLQVCSTFCVEGMTYSIFLSCVNWFWPFYGRGARFMPPYCVIFCKGHKPCPLEGGHY
jgi:hypothetical protein